MTYLSAAIARKARTGLTAQLARSRAIAAPTKGWNTRDPIFNMDPLFATILDNWFPERGFVGIRRGFTEHATGVGSGAVEALHHYESGNTIDLLAMGGGAIYDATAAGAATSLASGFSGNRWHGVNFNAVALLGNGTDAPQTYNGTTVTATGWTGPSDVTKLKHPLVHKERVYWIEDGTASFWFGGIDAITGALSEFPLGTVFPGGGRLKAMGTFTHDGGNGPDDFVAFFMNSGDVLVYAGNDPADSTNWTLIGRYKIGRVIGSRPLLNIGPDLIAITADGFMPVEQFLRAGRSRRQLAVSDNIAPSVREAVRTFADNEGWQLTLYPRSNMMIANIPLVQNQQADQYVMNTLTGAWCRFTDINAASWEVSADMAYFGGTGGKVFEFDSGNNDDGSAISTDAQTAFIYFGGTESEKRYTMFRPTMTADSDLAVAMGLGVDFEENVPTVNASSIPGSGAEWDVAEWDVAEWEGGFRQQSDWQSADRVGRSAAIRLKTQTNGINARWFATDVVWERGGII
ncbi:MAG: hypothetical protein ACR2RA_04965 [Geminicoccaceae bacterium]